MIPSSDMDRIRNSGDQPTSDCSAAALAEDLDKLVSILEKDFNERGIVERDTASQLRGLRKRAERLFGAVSPSLAAVFPIVC